MALSICNRINRANLEVLEIFNIKLMRIKSLLSQSELAEKLDVKQSSVSRWETGDTKPAKKYIRKMCELFDCTIDELMGDAPNG